MKRILSLLAVSAVVSTLAVGQGTMKYFTTGNDPGKAWLGVVIRDASGDAGVLVTEVVEDSPAEEAGLLEDDVIVSLDDRTIRDTDDLIRAVRKADVGASVEITVERDGARKTLTAKLDRMKSPKWFAFTPPEIPRMVPHPYRLDFPGRAWMYGLEVRDLGKQLAEYFQVPGNRGVLVTSVKKKSAAEKAGVKAGDVIVRVNTNTVLDTDDLMNELSDAEEGDVPVDLVRKGKPLTVTLRVKRDGAEDDLSSRLREMRFRLQENQPWAREKLRIKGEMLDEIRERLRDLRDELKDGAVQIRDAVRREIRNL